MPGQKGFIPILAIIKVTAILIFIAITGLITLNLTKTIFSKVIANITEKIVGNLTSDITKSIGGTSLIKLDKKPCNMPKTKREFKNELYFSGPLIDSHVHFPTSSKIISSVAGQNGLQLPVLEGELEASNLICQFESQGIIKTIAFHITSKFAEGASTQTAKAIEEVYPGKIINFIMPPPVKALNMESSAIKGILENNKGLFRGYGELALYMDGYEGSKPDDPEFNEIYKLAMEHKLIVMIHPEDNLREGIEEILKEFPNVTFFFHGGRDQEWIIDLMDEYKNFYYSLDGDLVSLYGSGGGAQYKKNDAKEEYLSFMRKNFNSNLEEAVSRWKTRINKYPDRFTWGTDRWYAWHFSPEVGEILEEFGRSFIGRLDPSVQENFAYKNAQKMLLSP